MKLKIINTDNTEVGQIDMPLQFQEEIREDLVKRAVLSMQSRDRQPYGADPDAGFRHSTRVSKRRRDYRGCYGHGISRSPRKVLSRRGTRFNWVGAEAAYARGGKRAHAPKVEKIWDKKINKKERRKAIRCALSATLHKETVAKRCSTVPVHYPFVLDDSFEALNKTKDVVSALTKLGFEAEIARTKEKKVRAGRGKSRGRMYKKKKGLLFVVTDSCKLEQAAKNIPGTDIVRVKKINAELLAPGAQVGRMTLFTKGAIEKMKKEKLFA